MANGYVGCIETWAYGLGAAFVGGGSSSVASGLAAMGLDKDHFNLTDGMGATLKLMTIAFLINGIISAFLYLKQSPLPPLQPGAAMPGMSAQPAVSPVAAGN